MPKPVRKAVFPVGGLGTRFLPATKSMPKEMLPVVDKPLIHYAFEEAREAGIEQFIFVTGRNKNAINNHFDHSYELERTLSDQQKQAALRSTRGWMPDPGNIFFTRQQEPLGLGHAVWCARHLIGDEPFAVLLADDMILSDTPCLKQMVDAHAESGGSLVAATPVAREKTSQYGIIDIEREDGRLVKAKGLVEKPSPEKAPSLLSITGRYILAPEIFEHLSKHQKGAGGEIQLTDAIGALLSTSSVYGYKFEGQRFDCGSLAGFLEANIAFALARPELAESLYDTLEHYLKSRKR